jgi:cytochrome c peroxidase
MTKNQQKGLSVFGGKGQCSKCHAGAELTDASVSFATKRGLINEDGGDQGFHNNGVTPTNDDLGRAGTGPHGVSFSESGSPMDRGAFKTPGLRNVGLRAPHFHNGGKKDLAAVVDFYSRGGDFNNPELAKRIKNLDLSSSDKAALVDFMQNALTDCRVEREEAPFDHPSLTVPNGRVVNGLGADLELAATGGGHACH